MTFEERVHALNVLGLTDRQTRFVVTVALHSGFCLRRQYGAFAGVAYGKNVRDFLDGLVARRIATRLTCERNRGHVYHLHAKSLYRALHQDENRNRRTLGLALIARKLMLLDFVLGEASGEWFATEQDKVALFRDRFQVPLANLPRRVYRSRNGQTEPTARYFVHKFPIYVTGDVVHFVCLVTDVTGQAFTQFVWDHDSLLRRLPAWAIVAVGPTHFGGLGRCEVVFDRYMEGSLRPVAVERGQELRWYFATRRAVEQHDVGALSVTMVDRFHAARRQFASAVVDNLYADWLVHGDAAIERIGRPDTPAGGLSGRLLLRELPFTYAQCGAWPGVA
jgi:hypothetical protein